MENNLTYIQVGEYLIPNLALPEQPDRDLGKYGRMRLRYLKEHRPGLFNRLAMKGTLFSHLLEIEDAAQSRLELLMPQLAKAAGVTQQLKASDQMSKGQHFIQHKPSGSAGYFSASLEKASFCGLSRIFPFSLFRK